MAQRETIERWHCSIHLDSCVTSIIDKFVQRSVSGKQKYGTDLDRDDLRVLDWITHAQEENMDAILYLEKLKQELQNIRFV
jgi:hypothetical protein